MARTPAARKTSATTGTHTPKKANSKPAAKPKTVKVLKTEIEKVLKPATKAANTVTNGSAAIDSHMVDGAIYKVVTDDINVYSTYLNFSDLRKNHNKFYIAQVVQRKTMTGKDYGASLYTRFGRVGVDGVKNQTSATYDLALKMYGKTVRAKISKGYTVIKLAAAKSDDAVAGGVVNQPKSKIKVALLNAPPSKLQPKVQDLMKFFFNEKLIESSVVSVNVDVKRMPLGQLSKETVLKGYQILSSIEKAINKKQTSELPVLTSQFYSYIPHNFGMAKMSNFIINSTEKIKEKYDLIQNLLDIQVAHEIMDKGAQVEKNQPKLKVNPIDLHFRELKCTIAVTPTTSTDYKMIERYVVNTSGHRRLKIKDCFTIEREGEDGRFNPQNLSNRKLLWHGSRFSNFPGILSQGMRIAPPEAPRSGFLFGKGVYFADMIGKSFPYCRPQISGGVGTFVLCEVALGKMRPLTRPDTNADRLPKGFSSTHAIGVQRPKPSESEYILNGEVEVPSGQLENHKAGGMGCNEFVVYNTNQIKMRYIIRCVEY